MTHVVHIPLMTPSERETSFKVMSLRDESELSSRMSLGYEKSAQKSPVRVSGGGDRHYMMSALRAKGDERSVRSTATLPCAPLFSFDESGDILPRSGTVPPNNSVESDYETTSPPPLSCCSNPSYSAPAKNKTNEGETLRNDVRYKCEVDDTKRPDDVHSTSVPPPDDVCGTSSAPINTTNSVVLHHPPNSIITQFDHIPDIDESAEIEQTPSTPATGLPTPPTPPLEVNVVPPLDNRLSQRDFHGPSIEVVEDYLEEDLDGGQIREFFSDTASRGVCSEHDGVNTGNVVTLLSATPQDFCSAPSNRRARVPFHTVVFTERKPSTGDALIRSLGLSNHGTDNTIQDIASKNKGLARERLHSNDTGTGTGDVWLTRQCESCGVSPEDCLKRLGVQPDNARPLTPSPKSERLWHFFHQVHEKLTRPPHPRRTNSTSGPEEESHNLRHQQKRKQSSPPHTRSLNTSPSHSSSTLDDLRKPRLNTV